MQHRLKLCSASSVHQCSADLDVIRAFDSYYSQAALSSGPRTVGFSYGLSYELVSRCKSRVEILASFSATCHKCEAARTYVCNEDGSQNVVALVCAM